MAIDVRAHARGSVLPVRARPGAKTSSLLGEHDGALRVQVAAPADQGKANQAIAELLASVLNVKRRQVELLGGPASRSKLFVIEGLDPAEVLGRLGTALATSNPAVR
jgi:uncharacterized protein (TIGR00251 family)